MAVGVALVRAGTDCSGCDWAKSRVAQSILLQCGSGGLKACLKGDPNRRVRANNTTEWKELEDGEADFEWVTWAIEVQANGGWGARWVAFTHRYPFQVVANLPVQERVE